MALRFAESGGQYHQSSLPGPGIWATASGGTIISSAANRNGSTWAYQGGGAFSARTFPMSSAQSGAILGFAMLTGVYNFLIAQFLLGVNTQCELRIDAGGHLFFTRNGTTIGSSSTQVLTQSVWHYIEFKALFSTTGTGTCEVVVDGVTWVTSTGLTNATTTATADTAQWNATSSTVTYMDFYFLDTVTGSNTTYLGDVTVGEIYANGPGVNAAWGVNQASFVLTSVASGTGVYQGTITNGATPTNAWQGFYFTVSGFTNGANNGTFLCTASTATSITLQNPSSVSETHAGTCAFQNPVQAGIHGGQVDGYATTNVGTRPPGDNQFISDNVTNDITDYAHQTLSLTGTIAGVIHMTLARKDDAGAQSMQQTCISTGSTEVSSTIGLPGTYQYFADILEQDPHTSAAWLLAGFNAATFGVKKV